MLKIILPATTALLFAGAVHADPPAHAHGEALPPGVAKQGKVPPGHAKKLWNRGEILPRDYRDHYIDDWRRYDSLYDAPDGKRWVRVDNEAYLIDITSGLVAEVLVDALN